MLKILINPTTIINGTPEAPELPSNPNQAAAIQSAIDAGDYGILPDPEPVPEPPQPKWNDFNVYMLTDPDFTTHRATARAIDPELTSALFVAYGKVAEGGFSTFEAIWNQWVTISGVTSEGKNSIATVAEGFDLPEDFINILRGQ